MFWTLTIIPLFFDFCVTHDLRGGRAAVRFNRQQAGAAWAQRDTVSCARYAG